MTEIVMYKPSAFRKRYCLNAWISPCSRSVLWQVFR